MKSKVVKKRPLSEIVADHIQSDEKFQDDINRVIFGDEELKEKGMKEKVDEMHSILVSAQNVGGFFTGIRGFLGWLLIFGAFIALAKGWLGSLVAYLISSK